MQAAPKTDVPTVDCGLWTGDFPSITTLQSWIRVRVCIQLHCGLLLWRLHWWIQHPEHPVPLTPNHESAGWQRMELIWHMRPAMCWRGMLDPVWSLSWFLNLLWITNNGQGYKIALENSILYYWKVIKIYSCKPKTQITFMTYKFFPLINFYR